MALSVPRQLNGVIARQVAPSEPCLPPVFTPLAGIPDAPLVSLVPSGAKKCSGGGIVCACLSEGKIAVFGNPNFDNLPPVPIVFHCDHRSIPGVFNFNSPVIPTPQCATAVPTICMKQNVSPLVTCKPAVQLPSAPQPNACSVSAPANQPGSGSSGFGIALLLAAGIVAYLIFRSY